MFAMVCGIAWPVAAQPSERQATQQSPGTVSSREVLVDRDETLVDIAVRELGSTARAAPLADFNRLPLDTVLQPGQSLRIPIHVPAVDDFALVVFVKGVVELNGQPVERGARVVSGDVLRTGEDGFAALRFTAGATVSLQPATEVTLQRLACRDDGERCSVELATGQGSLDVNIHLPDGQPADVRVTNPFATAAVRGTGFSFAADPGTMRVAVLEGEVLTEALGTQIVLSEGFGSITREGEPPGQPQTLLPAPVLRNVPARSSGDDRLHWWPLDEAVRYRATLSGDSAGVRTLAQREVEGTTLALGDIAPGELFLRLAAIDGNGLPGLASSTRVVVATIDAALPTPTLSIERQGQAFLVAVDEPPPDAAGFEIQLATDADFEDPLSADVGPTGQAVFRLDVDAVFARARQLDTPLNVSAFGPTARVR